MFVGVLVRNRSKNASRCKAIMLGSRRSTITDYSRLSVNMCWTVVVAQPFFKWRSNIFCSDGNEIWESHLADPKKCNSSLYLPPQSARKCPAEVWQIVSLHLRPFYLAIHCDLGSLGGSRFWGQPLHSSRSFFRMPSWGVTNGSFASVALTICRELGCLIR